MALRQRAPLGTLIASLVCVVLAFALWRTINRWGKAYVAGNFVDGYPDVTKDNWNGGVQFTQQPDADADIVKGAIDDTDALAKVIELTPDRKHWTPLIRQAEAIERTNLATVADPSDREDVTERYEMVMAMVGRNRKPTISEVTPATNGFDQGATSRAI